MLSRKYKDAAKYFKPEQILDARYELCRTHCAVAVLSQPWEPWQSLKSPPVTDTLMNASITHEIPQFSSEQDKGIVLYFNTVPVNNAESFNDNSAESFNDDSPLNIEYDTSAVTADRVKQFWKGIAGADMEELETEFEFNNVSTVQDCVKKIRRRLKSIVAVVPVYSEEVIKKYHLQYPLWCMGCIPFQRHGLCQHCVAAAQALHHRGYDIPDPDISRHLSALPASVGRARHRRVRGRRVGMHRDPSPTRSETRESVLKTRTTCRTTKRRSKNI